MRNTFLKSASLGFALLIVLGLTGCSSNLNEALKGMKRVSQDEIKVRMEKFINEAFGATVKITEVTVEKGLYKMKVDAGSGQIIDSYATKDGTLFFPQAVNVEEFYKNKEGAASSTDTSAETATPVNIPKTAKPVVELFVMSYCPYGTQIEKGIIPVMELLKTKADIKIKFCDYAMHGEKELAENLNQYCISKDQPTKFVAYLKCFLEKSDSATCVKDTGVNASALASCVKKADSQFAVTANFKANKGFKGSYPGFDIYKADNAKYNVGGSPTLIINGVEVNSGRDPQSLLTTICSAFKTAPAECEQKLSTDTPSAGFGSGTQAASATSANCATQ